MHLLSVDNTNQQLTAMRDTCSLAGLAQIKRQVKSLAPQNNTKKKIYISSLPFLTVEVSWQWTLHWKRPHSGGLQPGGSHFFSNFPMWEETETEQLPASSRMCNIHWIHSIIILNFHLFIIYFLINVPFSMVPQKFLRHVWNKQLVVHIHNLIYSVFNMKLFGCLSMSLTFILSINRETGRYHEWSLPSCTTMEMLERFWIQPGLNHSTVQLAKARAAFTDIWKGLQGWRGFCYVLIYPARRLKNEDTEFVDPSITYILTNWSNVLTKWRQPIRHKTILSECSSIGLTQCEVNLLRAIRKAPQSREL